VKFVIGGSFQGKKEYAIKKFPEIKENLKDGSQCEEADIWTCKGIYNFQEYIRRFELKEVDNFLERLMEQSVQIVIISNEIGYGIVPMDKTERIYRENLGRICCKVAACSDEVYRVVCGIGARIK
jgi:Adenosyl cobinamide kinase/adenosyl cobinamide phosphate guanylyltransferase